MTNFIRSDQDRMIGDVASETFVSIQSMSFKTPCARIGAILLSDACQVYFLLANIVRKYRNRGYRVGGVLQEKLSGEKGCSGDIILNFIGSGKTTKISQDLGKSAKGCRADSAALAAANALIEASVESGNIDLLILNRFGRCEAEGGGMRSVIESACINEIPMLIPVRPEYADTWNDFSEDLSKSINQDFDSVSRWCDSVLIQK